MSARNGDHSGAGRPWILLFVVWCGLGLGACGGGGGHCEGPACGLIKPPTNYLVGTVAGPGPAGGAAGASCEMCVGTVIVWGPFLTDSNGAYSVPNFPVSYSPFRVRATLTTGTPPVTYSGITAPTNTSPVQIFISVPAILLVQGTLPPCGSTLVGPGAHLGPDPGGRMGFHPRLDIRQPDGPGSFGVDIDSRFPGGLSFTAISSDAANLSSPGTGIWFGLHVPPDQLLVQLQAGVPPFLMPLDSGGRAFFRLPPGSVALPPATVIHAIACVFMPELPSAPAVSQIASATLN